MDQLLPFDEISGDKNYHFKPDHNSIVRSSCSYSTPTQAGYDMAEFMYGMMESGEHCVEDCFEHIRNELKKSFELPEGTGIFFAASNNSAQLIPILIVKALNADKEKFISIVPGFGEIGNKTVAAAGVSWSEVTPIEEQEITPVYNFSDDLEIKAFRARDKNGNVKNNEYQIEQLLDKCESDGKVPILHSVYGTSTGIQERVLP